MTLVLPRFVLPLTSDSVLENHGVAFDANGVIEEVLPRDSALQKYPSYKMIERPEHVMLPGFVNAHSHCGLTLLRGIADDMSLQQWLREFIWPAESTFNGQGDDFMRTSVRLSVAEALRGGTTCFGDMYFRPSVTAKVFRETGIRGVIGCNIFEFEMPGAGTCAKEYLQEGEALMKQVHAQRDEADGMITYCPAPHAPYTVSEDTFQECHRMATEYQTPLMTHLQETDAEVRASLAPKSDVADGAPRHLSEHCCTPTQNLRRLGLLNERFIAVHYVSASDEDMAAMAEAGCSVVHCPTSNLKLGSGVARVPAMLEAGINVALGTDSAASNNSLDLWREMRLAALLAKAAHGFDKIDASALNAYTAVRMATVNGARALGIEHLVGTIEAGKRADVQLVRLQADDMPELAPMYDVFSHLVYVASRHDVTDVFVQGRHLVKERRLQHMDERAVVLEARAWQQRVLDAVHNRK